MVLCQPGTMVMPKSQDTMVCTENITGMMTKAKMVMASFRWRHSASLPRHPSARTRYNFCRQPVLRSRAIARSGISGRYRYSVLPMR